MAKICRIIQINLNQLVSETDLPIKRILDLWQWQTFLRVFTYKMAAKSAGMDMDISRYGYRFRHCHPDDTVTVSDFV